MNQETREGHVGRNVYADGVTVRDILVEDAFVILSCACVSVVKDELLNNGPQLLLHAAHSGSGVASSEEVGWLNRWLAARVEKKRKSDVRSVRYAVRQKWGETGAKRGPKRLEGSD